MGVNHFPVVTVIEPTWDRHTHLPANLGLLRVVIAAYPEARINFIGGQGQIDLMSKATGDEFKERVNFIAWAPQLDRDTLPVDLYQTYIRLQKLPFEVFKGATRLVFCSCTATVLTAVTVLGLAKRSSVVLHGNANDLSGWRSKNPARRWLDFPASMQRFVYKGGRAIVLENRLVTQLSNLHPWMKENIICIPHPILPEERKQIAAKKKLSYPIHIGFAGNASIDKGFKDFLDFAEKLNSSLPGMYLFHAIGFLPRESRNLDQSILTTHASDALTRNEYLSNLSKMNFLFLWHQEKYYANAPSGVVYDSINHGIPLIARDYAQLSEWKNSNFNVAYTYSTVDDAIVYFKKTDEIILNNDYESVLCNLEKLRLEFSNEILAKKLRSNVNL